MSGFALALALFVLLHVGVSATPLRARLVGRFGEGAYRAAFALASLALLIWMLQGFAAMRRDPFDELNTFYWAPPYGLRHLAYLLILIGFLFIASSFTVRNPTLAGMEGALHKPEPARGIIRITRHPFLWGVVFWAAAHLLVNSERFAPMLFGALGLMAIYGARSIDRKSAVRDPEAWARFAAVTSNLPFAAIFQKRNTLVFKELWLGLAIGVVGFLAFGYFHGAIIGQPAF